MKPPKTENIIRDFPSHPCLWSCRFLFVVSLLFPEYKWFVVLLHIAMLTVGLLFILDFKFRKPTNRELVIIVAVVSVAVLLVLFYNEGWWKFNYLYKLSMERGGNL